VVSILLFIVGQLKAPPDYASINNNPWGNLFGTTVVMGITFFIIFLIIFIFDIKRNLTQKRKIKNTDTSLWYIELPLTSWIVSMGVFVLLLVLYALNGKNSGNQEVISSLYVPIFLFGIASFCFLMLGLLVKKFFNLILNKSGKINRKKLLSFPATLFITIFIILITATSVFAGKYMASGKLKSILNSATPSPSASSEPTPTPTVNPKPKENVNSDPIIPCTMTKECGGQVKQIKRSECTNGTCCQMGNVWIWYSSVTQCKKDQTANQPPQQVQKPTQPNSQLTFHCYNNTYNYWYYTSSGEQCNLDNSNSSLSAICSNNVKSFGEYKDCQDNCNNEASQGTQICLAAYSGSDALIEDNWDLFKECDNEVTDIFLKCLDTCSPLYSKVYNKCMGN
jgi:uncharacterized membrane protein YhaH (DUF805 family)